MKDEHGCIKQLEERKPFLSALSSWGNSTLLKGNTHAMNSTVAPITITTPKEGRLTSQLQHGLWGNRFSFWFHTDCPGDTRNIFQLSALACWPQETGHLTPETGARGAIPRNIRRSGAMWRSRTLMPKGLLSTVEAQRGPTEPSAACQNKVLNTEVLKP